MPAEAVLATLHALQRVLATLGVPFALAGGLALAIWKHPRFTKDVDVVLALGETSREQLVNALRDANFHPKHGKESATLTDFEVLQFRYEPPEALVDVQVDLLLAANEYQMQALERRRSVEVPEFNTAIDVLSCEDVIIHKLIAGRIIDLVDAANLLRINRDSIDLEYVDHWVVEKRLSAEFTQVWNEAFPDDPMT